jgi:acyl transferase domain-containing protein/NADPH:quinone reductase-like Zn-dependent oxidoreductase/acyl carrier protein
MAITANETRINTGAFTGLEIGVIGLAGRFPGAKHIHEFWENLKNGIESISFFNEEELEESGLDPGLIKSPHYIRAHGAMTGLEYFDSVFFGYSTMEADIMDPQIRVFHECAWAALEDAGYSPSAYQELIGVYAGATNNINWIANMQLSGKTDEIGGFAALSLTDKDYLSLRISYKLNLKGPAVIVQSACSTSLVSIHMACQALLGGECDMALAGGVTINAAKAGYVYREGMILSPDGHCRSFDAKAKGTVPGSGVGIVVLKRLQNAVSDGDHIYAVVKGSAVNNDGIRKVGFTAPSIDGQAEAIITAQEMAEVEPQSITYLETHGTGTDLGDPVEFEALKLAFNTGEKAYCALGSVKTNIGHLDSAAGAAGFIKAVLCLHYRMIPPCLHYESPNPKIDFENSPFYVNTTLKEWKNHEYPLRAGVSSFGIGGTNAHVILEEAPKPVIGHSSLVIGENRKEQEYQLILLSAKTETALGKMTKNLVSYFKNSLQNQDNHKNPIKPGPTLADVAYTLQLGREAFKNRKMLVCQTVEEAIRELSSPGTPEVLSFETKEKSPTMVFMFPGQGAQYVDMGWELYQNQPVFREELDRCFEILEPLMGCDVKEILYPGGVDNRSPRSNKSYIPDINQTEVTQPVIFAIEYALAKQFMKWGIQPDAMIGHSIGEYVAAHLAGVFTLEDALRIVALRGKLMQRQPPGAMLSIVLPEEQLQPLLAQNPQLALAAVNSPTNCTVSGPGAAIDEFEKQLKEKQYECRQLHTSHAFHSSMMDPILQPLEAAASQIKMKEPEIPYISNLTGTWFTAGQAAEPGYWAKHLRHTVRFSEGIKELQKKQPVIFLEIGPGKTLTTFVKLHNTGESAPMTLNSLRHPRENVPDIYYLYKRIGQLWLYGKTIHWQEIHEQGNRRRVSLPGYPFEGLRYHLEMEAAVLVKTGKRKKEKPIPGEILKSKLDQWFSIPTWKPSPIPGDKGQDPLTQLQSGSGWLVLVNEGDWGEQWVKRLRQANQEVSVVRKGPGFAHPGQDEYVVKPGQDSDYKALFTELRSARQMPRFIIHLWNVTENPVLIGEAVHKQVDDGLDLGFYSILALARAIGMQTLSNETDDMHKVKMTVLTNRMQGVTGQEKLEPQKAVVRGSASVIPAEYPAITCRTIDIDTPPGPAPAGESEFIETLLADILSDAADIYTAYRVGQRWVQAFTPVTLERAGEEISLLKEKGVYLITGGLGGIGLVLAEYLARAYKARLILMGRSTFPGRQEWEEWQRTHDPGDETSIKIRKIQELETIGAEVLILQADVANLQQVQTAVARAENQWGTINGIIHAAGLPDGGLIQRRTRDMSETVFNPKIRGTLVLDKIFNNRTGNNQLEFILLCSSISSLLAPAGQAAYCAANAFLDAFARAARQNRGASSLPYTAAVNWDAWQEVGMAVKASQSAPPRQKLKSPHPLFNTRDIYEPGHEEFVTTLSINQHWVLDEHRIMGIAALPGTAYLEMARAAAAALHPGAAIELEDVYFLNPLTVKENRQKQVRTVLKKVKDEEYTFSVMTPTKTDAQQWQEHCRGKARCLREQDAKQKQYEIEELKAGCPGTKKTFQLENRPYNFGSMTLGPRWDNLRQAQTGKNQAFGYLELPETFTRDLETYKLHPALLDMANLLLERVSEDKGPYMPFYYKKIKIKAPLPGKIFCRARSAKTSAAQQETRAYNITIIDSQGKELVEIEEYTLKKVKTGQPTARRFHDLDFSGENNISLGISTPGSFDNLEFRPTARQSPGPGEVEISVFATGLNFKEVLTALGALGPIDPGFTFGYECSGKITACGQGVENFKKGDDVIAFGASCFSSYIATPAFLVAHKPANLGFEAAATIPMAFMTAYYALVKLGNLSDGERVLIHSAAGGVGMAAVQIARWKGAEIFATAGNEEKRSYLRSQGIQHVMNSRTLDFADEVMKYTDGKGVNLVLNSLSGEFIPKSLSLLAPYGRFLEIGIRDMINNTPLGLRSFLNGAAYFNASLAADIPGIETVWKEVVQNFNEGVFTPLPHRTFAIEEVDRAFEYMSTGTHIGKIVVTRTERLEELPQAQQDAAQKNPLKHGILPAEGIEAFKRILANEEYPQVVVCTTDFLQRMKKTHGYSGAYLREEMKKTLTTIPKQARPEISTPYTAPGTETEKILAHIWQQFLGIRQVGIHDDFFELGGDSLKMMTIISKIHKALEVEIPIDEFFSRPTIAKLSRYITGAGEQVYSSIQPVESKEYYPLSASQERLYMLQRMEPLSLVYNLSYAVILEGDLKPAKMHRVFDQLIRRHESFRTAFIIVEGETVQRVNKETKFEIDYYEMKEDPDGQVIKSCIHSFIRPFDLSRPPLLRVGLVEPPHTPAALRRHPSQEVKGDKYLLMVDMHHIISDGLSIGIFIREFMALYGEKELPALPIRYKDYTQWRSQRFSRGSETYKQQEAYWLKEIQGEIPVLNLPVDFPRPDIQGFVGSSLYFTISSEDTRKLNQLAAEQEVSLYVLMLSVLNIFIAKITGQEDILIGTQIAARRHADLENIIGMFINTLVMRNYPEKEKTITGLLKEIKQRTLSAFENQEYPFEDLVKKRLGKRELNRNPFFDVMFIWQNLGIEKIRIPGLDVKPYKEELKPTALIDLTVYGYEGTDKIIFMLEYNTGLYKKETIERFIGYIREIIAIVIAGKEIKLKDIKISHDLGKAKSGVFQDEDQEFGF